MALYVNNILITPTIFPDKTSQVWKLPEELFNPYKYPVIRWTFEYEGEFVQLAQIKDLLNSQQIDPYLEIDYLPYARQDKDVSNNSTFALHTFAKLLNSLNFPEIFIVDPHSETALKLINNAIAYFPNFQKYANNETILCFPDNGAVTKYTDNCFIQREYIYGNKVRDQLTGNITSYEVIGDCKDKNVLIVDDICDGGGTFILLTKQLLEKGAKEVNLFVSHGLFTKGLQVLKDSGINKIYTRDGEVAC